MTKTLSDVQSEISFGKITAPEYNGHNSLDRSPFVVNKHLMERQFHAPCMKDIVFYMVLSGQRGKICERRGSDKV
jgi:hypothetical protein